MTDVPGGGDAGDSQNPEAPGNTGNTGNTENPDDTAVPPEPARAGLVLGAHWGFLTFFLGIAGFQLATLVLGAVLSAPVGEIDPLELRDIGPVLLLAFLPNLLLGLAPVLGARRWGRGPLREFGLLPTGRDLAVGLACGGLALLAGYLLNLVLLAAYGTDQFTDSPLTELSEGVDDSTLWLLLAALVVAVVAPLTEELLVRGALWNALERHRLPGWVIVVLTAVVFALLHGEPSRTIALLGQGIAIGLARKITGRLGAGVVAHMANNLPPALLLIVGN